MLEDLLVWERDVFLMLNGSDSSFLDNFMWIYSGKMVWLPLAIFIIFVLCYKKNWKECLLILLAIVLTITLCDQFASHVCKPIFTRFRPTHHPDFVDQVKVVFGYRGGKYGFISSHAANAFGFATLMALLMRDRFLSFTLLLWALMTSYTRIYLGVHFISDIVPGILSGSFFGYIVYNIYVKVRPVVIGEVSPLPPDRLYSKSEKRSISYAVWIMVAFIAMFNEQLVSCLK